MLADAPPEIGEELEVTLETAPLRAAIIDYGLRILQLSLVLSLITAAMVFFAVRWFVVRPITRVVAEVKRFSENPEDPDRIIRPPSRLGEIAEAEQRGRRDAARGALGAARAGAAGLAGRGGGEDQP